MQYELLALDLDGTTLTSSGEIRPSTSDAIKRARVAGLQVVLVTGRHHVATRPFHHELGLETPAICCNGTYVYDFGNNRVECGDPLPKDQAHALLDVCRRHDIHALVYTRNAMTFEVRNAHMDTLCAWANRYPPAIRPLIQQVESFEAIIDDASLIWKFVVSHDNADALSDWARDAKSVGQFSIEQSWRNRLDVVLAGNSKGGRLVAWASMHGIPPERIIAIGDHENDISMIASVGCGVAMGNAEPGVKAAAKMVVADNNNDGVAEAVARLIG